MKKLDTSERSALAAFVIVMGILFLFLLSIFNGGFDFWEPLLAMLIYGAQGFPLFLISLACNKFLLKKMNQKTGLIIAITFTIVFLFLIHFSINALERHIYNTEDRYHPLYHIDVTIKAMIIGGFFWGFENARKQQKV